jgi:hypothetical protein
MISIAEIARARAYWSFAERGEPDRRARAEANRTCANGSETLRSWPDAAIAVRQRYDLMAANGPPLLTNPSAVSSLRGLPTASSADR